MNRHRQNINNYFRIISLYNIHDKIQMNNMNNMAGHTDKDNKFTLTHSAATDTRGWRDYSFTQI